MVQIHWKAPPQMSNAPEVYYPISDERALKYLRLHMRETDVAYKLFKSKTLAYVETERFCLMQDVSYTKKRDLDLQDLIDYP